MDGIRNADWDTIKIEQISTTDFTSCISLEDIAWVGGLRGSESDRRVAIPSMRSGDCHSVNMMYDPSATTVSQYMPPWPDLDHQPQRQKYISDDMYAVIQDVMLKMQYATFSIAILLNILNIAVFLKMGVKDVMTLSLLSLSISDLLELFTGSSIIIMVSLMKSHLALDLLMKVDMFALIHWMMFVTCIGQSTSTNITTMIAMERCLCVIAPFKLKTIVTMRRTRIAIFAIVVIGVLGNVPNFVSSRFARVYNPMFNVTRVEILYTPNRRVMEELTVMINHAVVYPVSLVIVTTSSIIMIRGLRRSAKFRQKKMGPDKAPVNNKTAGSNKVSQAEKTDSSVVTTSVDHQGGTSVEKENNGIDCGSRKEMSKDNGADSGISCKNRESIINVDSKDSNENGSKSGHMGQDQSKSTSTNVDKPDWSPQRPVISANNVRLIKMLLIVALVTASFHVISLLIGLATFDREIKPDGFQANAYHGLVQIAQLFYAWSMGINTFVYIKYNRKYKRALIAMCFGICRCFNPDWARRIESESDD
ncbi:hypothetical protein EGW08_002034 [Elysia chlorotica]|uniref:G-protein coupled receptors family 1 profile domain-containing protein n=1 Tax=Elysia chlorotica TaxID=188477 RepID=A0A3S1I131_ELYCH|nr:hypothetical protein EGW08_002034 [Elysia chlorotica]